MTTMTFSNLDFVKNLRSTGLTIEQSEAISNGSASVREDMKHLSTKDDIKEVKEDFKVLKEDFKEIKADFKEVQNDLEEHKNEVKAEFRQLRKDINDWRHDLLSHFDTFQSNVQNRLISHCSTLFIGCTTAIIGIMTLFHTLN